ncbi:MAG: class I SAM-dependent methyltransferase [Anaerolineae bacterium]|nr:class I SAM-dependent methyltransferase [Anaerolineae bacterium]
MSRDLDRLRREYARRSSADGRRYSLANPSHLYTVQRRQRATVGMLQRYGISLTGKRILEIGCGHGEILYEYLGYCAGSSQLHGSDLIFDRVEKTHVWLPQIPLTCADGQSLPYAASSFDLVLQYTVLTSILDDGIKRNLAAEMCRVVKPDGAIVWYDFWLNPTNPHAKGIRPPEIRWLFPGCDIHLRRVTLAPPITRLLIPPFWGIASLLENLRIFDTHYLALIRPKKT